MRSSGGNGRFAPWPPTAQPAPGSSNPPSPPPSPPATAATTTATVGPRQLAHIATLTEHAEVAWKQSVDAREELRLARAWTSFRRGR